MCKSETLREHVATHIRGKGWQFRLGSYSCTHCPECDQKENAQRAGDCGKRSALPRNRQPLNPKCEWTEPERWPRWLTELLQAPFRSIEQSLIDRHHVSPADGRPRGAGAGARRASGTRLVVVHSPVHSSSGGPACTLNSPRRAQAEEVKGDGKYLLSKSLTSAIMACA